ncbi:MAG: hypothetical protein ACOYL7_18520 [Caldilinea sp.]
MLLESLRGERHALQRYQSASQRLLPVAVTDRLERQVETIKGVCDQLEQMAECGDEALVLQLYPDGQSARAAAVQLAQDWALRAPAQVTTFQPDSSYACQCQRQRVLACAGAGALSGAAVGGLLGIVVGVALLLAGEVGDALGVIGASLALACGIGCLFGAIVDAVVGQGVTGEDAYVYAESLRRYGAVLAVATSRADSARVQASLQQNVSPR